MSTLLKHIEEIDEFSEKLVAMGKEGHLNGFYANTYSGSVQKWLSYLREALLKNGIKKE